jgi:thioesterase domain-containing protein
LINLVPAGHPIYGIQARTLLQEGKAPGSIEDMAADYVDLIRQVQPHGPYNLLGWSFGGLVAHAMATRLRSLHERVALLALLDSYPFDRESGGGNQPGELLAANAEITLHETFESLRRNGYLPNGIFDNYYETVKRACNNNARITKTFTPKEFDGDMLIFVAANCRSQSAAQLWKPYVGGKVQVHPIDCMHHAMMDAMPAQGIGRVLSAELLKQRSPAQPPVRWRTK